MTTELVAFLRARHAEDEKAAREAAADGHPQWKLRDHEAEYPIITDGDGGVVVYDEGYPSDAEAAHIVRWDPARVLRAVAARRAIVDRCAAEVDDPTSGGSIAYVVLCQLAAEYDEHPDYRQEWHPGSPG